MKLEKALQIGTVAYRQEIKEGFDRWGRDFDAFITDKGDSSFYRVSDVTDWLLTHGGIVPVVDQVLTIRKGISREKLQAVRVTNVDMEDKCFDYIFLDGNGERELNREHWAWNDQIACDGIHPDIQVES